MPSARSWPAGLPSSSSVATTSRTSSRSWKTIPKHRPNSVRASTSSRVGPAGERADPARGGHEGRRLPGDGLEVLLLGPADLEGRADLGHLALAEPAEGGGQQPGDLGAQAGGDGRRAGEQVVAGHDGHQVAEAAVHALDVAADRRLVDDVVVVEGGQVDELDRHRRPGGRPRWPAGRRRWPRPGPGVGRRRLPPAAIRWVVTSSRKASPVATDVMSRGSSRCRSSSSWGRPRASGAFTTEHDRRRADGDTDSPGPGMAAPRCDGSECSRR